jgi:membrane protein required for colicin V production
MNVADWLILAAIVFSVLIAASQGFFYEVISLAGTVVGYLIASWQYPRVAYWIAPHVTSEWIANIFGFLIIFVAVIVVAGVIAKLARWAMRKAGLTWFDRALGAMFGLLRGSLMVSIVLMVMTAFTPTSAYLMGSQLAPYFLVVGRAAIWVAPSALRAQFYQGLDMVREAHP